MKSTLFVTANAKVHRHRIILLMFAELRCVNLDDDDDDGKAIIMQLLLLHFRVRNTTTRIK